MLYVLLKNSVFTISFVIGSTERPKLNPAFDEALKPGNKLRFDWFRFSADIFS